MSEETKQKLFDDLVVVLAKYDVKCKELPGLCMDFNSHLHRLVQKGIQPLLDENDNKLFRDVI